MGLSGIPMSLMKLLHKQGQDVDNDPDGLLIGQLSIWSAFRRHFCPWRASCPVAFQRQPLLLFLHWKAYT